jgi:hypothetical protein
VAVEAAFLESSNGIRVGVRSYVAVDRWVRKLGRRRIVGTGGRDELLDVPDELVVHTSFGVWATGWGPVVSNGRS